METATTASDEFNDIFVQLVKEITKSGQKYDNKYHTTTYQAVAQHPYLPQAIDRLFHVLRQRTSECFADFPVEVQNAVIEEACVHTRLLQRELDAESLRTCATVVAAYAQEALDSLEGEGAQMRARTQIAALDTWELLVAIGKRVLQSKTSSDGERGPQRCFKERKQKKSAPDSLEDLLPKKARRRPSFVRDNLVPLQDARQRDRLTPRHTLGQDGKYLRRKRRALLRLLASIESARRRQNQFVK